MRRFISSMVIVSRTSCVVLVVFLFALPVSTNYQLKSYEFGSGGVGDSASYSTEGVTGDVQGVASSSSYGINAGLTFVQNANVPTVTLSNTSNWYNKLLVIVGIQSNPTDATYAIAISSDNFVTTQYVQNDNTVGSTLGSEDYQTYTAWGAAVGEYIIGLTANTSYSVKVKAFHDRFTESAYGPSATASTANVNLSFDIDIGGSSDPGETAYPYGVALGELNTGVVTTATNRVWVDMTTNAEAGGYIYIYDQYSGLRSTNVNHTIAAVSNDLGSVQEGFGLQAETVTQSSGGPLVKVSPYNGTSNTVGLVDTTIREIFSTTSSPVTSARGSFLMKSKASIITPASADYTDTLTLIASSNF